MRITIDTRETAITGLVKKLSILSRMLFLGASSFARIFPYKKGGASARLIPSRLSNIIWILLVVINRDLYYVKSFSDTYQGFARFILNKLVYRQVFCCKMRLESD